MSQVDEAARAVHMGERLCKSRAERVPLVIARTGWAMLRRVQVALLSGGLALVLLPGSSSATGFAPCPRAYPLPGRRRSR